MKCPKCAHKMRQEYLDGPFGRYYLAWICPHCGYEQALLRVLVWEL